jgi:hypothetical protein
VFDQMFCLNLEVRYEFVGGVRLVVGFRYRGSV